MMRWHRLSIIFQDKDTSKMCTNLILLTSSAANDKIITHREGINVFLIKRIRIVTACHAIDSGTESKREIWRRKELRGKLFCFDGSVCALFVFPSIFPFYFPRELESIEAIGGWVVCNSNEFELPSWVQSLDTLSIFPFSLFLLCHSFMGKSVNLKS